MADRARGRAAGRVKPISQYVLKVHSRCDLACDHCYVYEHADQSWRRQPIGIEPAVARQAAARIAEHAAAHSLPEVRVVLHGGEPLLLGEQRLRGVLTELRDRITPVSSLDLRLQTNGVQLSPALCTLFAEYQVKIGVSLDGDRAANDLHRRFVDGRSSHAQVRRALKLLRSADYRGIYSGILCTVDLANDPIAVFDALLAEEPPRIDFLLPHGNWDHPPPRPQGAETAYADWLARIFDHWGRLGRPVPIRLFDSIEALALGGESGSEAIGPSPVDLLVIETDGSWEQVDSLKSAYEGAATTGMNVFDHPVDLAAAHPAVAGRQEGVSGLCDTCLACPVVSRCGGGLYAHRYRSGTGFRNPSVYCNDLKRLIEHVGTPDHPSTIPMARIRVRGGEEQALVRSASSTDLVPGLNIEDIDAIAAGPVDQALAQRIAAVHLMITRMVFEEIGDRSCALEPTPDSCAKEAWDVLCELHVSASEAVRTVFAHPFARAWAVRCLKATPDREPPHSPESSHLASFAMAAAIRAQRPSELRIPLRGGVAYLPTLGAWDLRRPHAQTAVIALRDGMLEACDGDSRPSLPAEVVTSTAPGAPESAWQSAREIGAGHKLLLEDLDPYRDCHGFPVTGRLTPDEVDRWHRASKAAIDSLEQWAPGHAAQVAACIRTLVPLAPDPSGHDRSKTPRDVFGAVGVALPARPETLAMLLVRESQHTVLNTVLDAHTLVDQAAATLAFSAASGSDGRPARSVLHDAFSSLAMAEVWLACDPASAAVVHAVDHTQSRAYAADAERALDTLRNGAALTPLGERFTAALYARLRRLRK